MGQGSGRAWPRMTCSLEGGPVSGLSFLTCVSQRAQCLQTPTQESTGLIPCSSDEERRKLFLIPLHAYAFLICKVETALPPVKAPSFNEAIEAFTWEILSARAQGPLAVLGPQGPREGTDLPNPSELPGLLVVVQTWQSVFHGVF